MSNINPLYLTIFLFVKAAIVMGALLGMASMCIWIERKASALIQNRIGANRAAFFGFYFAGVVNTLVCDPVKALFKEDWIPKGVSGFMHACGPFLALVPVIVSFAVIPFGPQFRIGDTTINLQLIDLDVGVLYVFAFGSLSVYGVVIAGWVSDNKFSLLGGLRASAQMISYEVIMGISILGLLVNYGTLSLNEIVLKQSGTYLGFLPNWGIFQLPPFNLIAFFIFFIAMMAETKRAPFDLPESESEIVAGYLTEYSGMKFLLFWLGEFAEIAVASSVITVLFLGGWQVPYFDISQPIEILGIPFIGSLIGVACFFVKVSMLCALQIVIRWTLPRFRYDQLMDLCWKLLLPISIVNLVLTSFFVLYIEGMSK